MFVLTDVTMFLLMATKYQQMLMQFRLCVIGWLTLTAVQLTLTVAGCYVATTHAH